MWTQQRRRVFMMCAPTHTRHLETARSACRHMLTDFCQVFFFFFSYQLIGSREMTAIVSVLISQPSSLQL